MTKNFTGKIGSETFEDVALFEAAAKTWRGPKTPARKEFGTAPTTGEAESLVKATRAGWKAPKRSKDLYSPEGFDLGADVVLRFDDGREIEGQVWSKAPGACVWVVVSWGGTFAVHEATGEIRNHPEERFSKVGLAA